MDSDPIVRDGARDRGVSIHFRDPDGSLLELISYTGGALAT